MIGIGGGDGTTVGLGNGMGVGVVPPFPQSIKGLPGWLLCFVLIDLKVGKLTQEEIGQMLLYTGYYETEMGRS